MIESPSVVGNPDDEGSLFVLDLHEDVPGSGMSFGVEEGLANHEMKFGGGAIGAQNVEGRRRVEVVSEGHRDTRTARRAFDQGLDGRTIDGLTVAVAAQVVQQLPQFGDCLAEMRAHTGDGGALDVAESSRDVIQFEPDRRERTRDPVVQLASHARALVVGHSVGEAGEDPGIVESQCEGVGDPDDRLGLGDRGSMTARPLAGEETKYVATRAQNLIHPMIGLGPQLLSGQDEGTVTLDTPQDGRVDGQHGDLDHGIRSGHEGPSIVGAVVQGHDDGVGPDDTSRLLDAALDDLVDIEAGREGDRHFLQGEKKFVGPGQMIDLGHGVVGTNGSTSFDEGPRHFAGRILHRDGTQGGVVRGPATTAIGHRGRVPVMLRRSVSP